MGLILEANRAPSGEPVGRCPGRDRVNGGLQTGLGLRQAHAQYLGNNVITTNAAAEFKLGLLLSKTKQNRKG